MDNRDGGRNSALRLRHVWESCASVFSRRAASIETLSPHLVLAGWYELRLLGLSIGRSVGTRRDKVFALRPGVLARAASGELGIGRQPSLVTGPGTVVRLVQSGGSQFSSFRDCCAFVPPQLGQLSFCADSGDACSLGPMVDPSLLWIGNLCVRSATEADIWTGDSLA